MYSPCTTTAGTVIFEILTEKYVLTMMAEHELIAMVAHSMWFFLNGTMSYRREEQRTEFHCGKWKYFYKRSH